MAAQVKLYFCFAALFGIVLGSSLKEISKIDESENLINYVTNTNVRDVTNDEKKVEKPVNELFPHAVLFGRICGGTILSPTWIITAAHCMINSFGWDIIAGTNSTVDNTGLVSSVKRRIVHPLFVVGPYWMNAREYHLRQIRALFDFLLVELDEPLPLNGVTIKAAILKKAHIPTPGMNVSFAGYGADEHGGMMSTIMHARYLQLLPPKECARIVGYDPLSMICAKGFAPNFDSACNGDSGSGLVDDNGVLLGVTSWVEDDEIECRKGAIVFFAKVATVLRWIREVTKL